MSTTPKSNEFERIPWREMSELARVLRAQGKDIPADAIVHLVPVPEHLRDENGRPMYRVAVYDPNPTDDALTEHLHEGMAQ